MKEVKTYSNGTTAYDENGRKILFPTEEEAVEFRREFCDEQSFKDEEDEQDD